MKERPILLSAPIVPRTNDVVAHRVTGEEWVVAFVEGGYLAPCGWPMCLVPVSECDIITRSTDEASEGLVRANVVGQKERAA